MENVSVLNLKKMKNKEERLVQPIKRISERYGDANATLPSLIEFPKEISRKRVLSRAWTWFRGNGAYRIPVFKEALKAAWKSEKDIISAGGAIYHPYIMSCPVNL